MHRVEPKVFLVGESQLGTGMLDYLNSIGTSWWARDETGTVSHAERMTEFFGRLCYRSWEPGMNPNVTKVREGNKLYLENILKSRHGSVLEHAVTHWVFADVSRVFTHELVRHRVGVAYSQESLRYVRLTDLGLWLPPEIENDPELVKIFEGAFDDLEHLQRSLADLLKLDSLTFEMKKRFTSTMRRIAPIGLATTIGMTMNFRTLRHFAELRSDLAAEAEMRNVVDQVMHIAVTRWPHFFQDFERNSDGEWQPQYSKI